MRWKTCAAAITSRTVAACRWAAAGLKLGGGGLLLIVVLSLLTGTNPLDILSGLEEAGPPSVDSGPQRKPPADDPQADFIRAILGDTEDTWTRLFEPGRRDLRAAAARPVQRGRPVRVRPGERGGRPVLLSRPTAACTWTSASSGS